MIESCNLHGKKPFDSLMAIFIESKCVFRILFFGNLNMSISTFSLKELLNFPLMQVFNIEKYDD